MVSLVLLRDGNIVLLLFLAKISQSVDKARHRGSTNEQIQCRHVSCPYDVTRLVRVELQRQVTDVYVQRQSQQQCRMKDIVGQCSSSISG
jgi:hypothetical protein